LSSASPAPEQRPAAWHGRSRGTPLGHRIFIFLIRRVGLWAAYTLLVPVSFYFVLAAREPGRAWLRYYARVHPTDRSPRWRVLFRAYHTFGTLIIDKAAVMAGLQDRFRTEHQAADTLQRILDEGRGGLLISAHIGNWQMASYMLKRYRGQVSVVMLDAEEQAIKRAHDEATQDKRFEVIALKDDMSHLFRIRGALAEGRLVCIHGDRSLAGGRTARMPFLGAEASFPLGPFAIAAAFDVPVCFAFVVRTAPREYTFTATDPLPHDRDPKVQLARFSAALEEVVKRHPFQWANFYDFWSDAPSAAPGRGRAAVPAAPPADRAGR
jgi:predicted LPLAT superfamily acyltransferase